MKRKTTLGQILSTTMLAFFLIPHLSFAQSDRGGSGGDVTTCNFTGTRYIYSLDYLWADQNYLASPAADASAAYEQIVKHLDSTLPELAKKMRAFKTSFENRSVTNYGSPLVWVKSNSGLVDSKSAVLNYRNLPEKCFSGVSQIVTLLKGKNQYRYTYDDAWINLILAETPPTPQLDWLLIHEFNWSSAIAAEDDNMNAQLNEYFHSKEFLTHTGEEIVKRLELLGVQTREQRWDGRFAIFKKDKTTREEVQKALQGAINIKCMRDQFSLVCFYNIFGDFLKPQFTIKQK